MATKGKRKGPLEAKTRVKHILEKHERMKSEKGLWNTLYQDIAEYVMTRKQGFTDSITPGEEQTDYLYDDTAPMANHLMASTMIGALWPNAEKSFYITQPFAMQQKKAETEEIKAYYEFVTTTMAEIMGHPRSGLTTSLEEYMLDQSAFGISGIGVFERDDADIPLTFTAVDAKALTIEEGVDGFVNTVYMEHQLTLSQLVEEYGYENLDPERKEAYIEGRTKDKVRVLRCMQPRIERDPFSFGAKDFPVASLHIDIDKQHILRESGFTELPVFVTRFWKAMGEKYGRSPAMNALPTIRELNATREALIVATEKQLDPPLVAIDDSVLGGGDVDTSAGAITTISINGHIGNMGMKPLEPLYTVGDLQPAYVRVNEMAEIIKNHFFQDRLLDLNNETRMTLGEANIRNELRGQSLGTIYSRQIAELFTPMLDRVFGILFRRGYLGVVRGSTEETALLAKNIEPTYIPDAIAKRMAAGQDVYKIVFVSPAARIMHTEELSGIQKTAEFAAMAAQIKPDVVDNLDVDAIIRRVRELTGAPELSVVSLDTVEKIRKERQAAEAEMMQAETGQKQSEMARNMAQAASMVGVPNGAQNRQAAAS